MRTSYHPRFFFKFYFINFFSFFLHLDNIIITLLNVRGTMRKEAEVNHAYILGCKSQYFFRATWDLASHAGVFWGARLRGGMKD